MDKGVECVSSAVVAVASLLMLLTLMMLTAGPTPGVNGFITRPDSDKKKAFDKNSKSGGQHHHQRYASSPSSSSCFCGAPTIWSDDNETQVPDEQRLLAKVLHNYNNNVRPVYNSNDSVPVTLGFTLVQIMDMDEKNQVLTLNAWLEILWKDPRFLWDPSQYNDLQVFRVPSKYIWLPDIVLYNNADDYTNGFMPCNAMLEASGAVSWSPPVKLRSSCQVDITFFPFDWQTCSLKFGSWSYDKAQVDLLNKTSIVDVSIYITNGEWTLHEYRIIRNEVVYPISDAVYPDVTIVLVIQRRILYYVLNILFPCFWLNILSVLTFCLPVDAGEKMTLSITVLLSYSVFMLLVAESLPPTSDAVPLIVIYLTMSMSMSSLSVIVTVLVEKLHFCVPDQKPLPKWAKILILGFFSRVVGCSCLPSWKKLCRKNHTVRSANAPEILVTPSSVPAAYRHNESPDVSVRLLGDALPLTSLPNHAHNKPRANSLPDRDDNMSLEVRCSSRKSSSNAGEWSAPQNAEFRLASASPQRMSAGSDVTKMSLYERANSGMEELLRYLKVMAEKREESEEEEAINDEWKQAAVVIDRLMFWVFMFITLFSTFVILVLVPATKFHEDRHGI
ncbi:neuronal acetylcholine receptor subunit alpha-10-like [Babylonia areolata]|uniref:neuronal acetylcholine receptor subunit alpha-10-like n=1 Tax=Babylonia areolata TaxID=304850 RepID=UPI003FD52951